MGIAAFLLTFTGIWHLTEFLMDRESTGAKRIVPAGAIYLALGILIALGIGGTITAVVALVAVIVGLALAYIKRSELDVRRWVMVSFVVIDVIIIVAIIHSLIGS